MNTQTQSSQTVHFLPSKDFRQRTQATVDNPKLRKSFRGAMDFLMSKRAVQFPDPEAFESMRDTGEAIRQYSLSRLPALLEQLETNLTRNGIKVHWAENAEEAQQIVIDLMQRAEAPLIVKGKSMVSEEIEL